MAEPTHIVKLTHKIYLRSDLTGGDRGSLTAGTKVVITAHDGKFGTYRVAEPTVGWGPDEAYEVIGAPLPPQLGVPFTLTVAGFEPYSGVLKRV